MSFVMLGDGGSLASGTYQTCKLVCGFGGVGLVAFLIMVASRVVVRFSERAVAAPTLVNRSFRQFYEILRRDVAPTAPVAEAVN